MRASSGLVASAALLTLVAVALPAVVAIAPLAVPAAAQDQPPAPAAPAKPWVGRQQPPDDPLAPWPLEPEPGTETPVPVPATPADTLGPGAAALPSPVIVDSTDVVQVVRCRQILVADPKRVPHLQRLLEQGVPLEQALQQLGITGVEQSRREYAVDELEPQVQAEIEALADSGWSRPRPWRGRTAFFQVLEREERLRHTLPRLGENLDQEEKNRLASQLRAPEQQQQQGAGADPELQPAAVLEQVPAQYPPGAIESGEVTVVVEVGRLGDVLGVRVENSTARVFDEAAITAARDSKYRAATRGGIAEPGSVRLTFKFAAPQTPQPASP